MKKVIYIAGPMRGLPESNYPQFENVARFLRSEGWDACSPVETGSAFGTADELNANPTRLAVAMEAERDALRTSCDAILLLPGWERSKGTRAELIIALEKNLEIITFCELMQKPYLYTPEKAEIKIGE